MVSTMTIRKLRRRRGQGMTEYIILVGLIAICLVAAVRNYKEVVRVTIEGSDGNGGMVGETNNVTPAIDAGGGTGTDTGNTGSHGRGSGTFEPGTGLEIYTGGPNGPEVNDHGTWRAPTGN
jgi:hypothetical protein